MGLAAVMFVAGSGLSLAQDFLPLETGNSWTYRSADGRETREIRVGTPVMTDGVAWYSVTGLAPKRLLVSRAADGSLHALDLDTDAAQVILRPNGSYETELSGCRQQASVYDKRVGYQGPLGFFSAALQVNYSASTCRDAGYEEDIYLENIGLARRTFQTIAGPRTLDLVSARVGKFSFNSDPSSVTRLSIDQSYLTRAASNDPLNLKAQLQIALFQTPSVKVRFESEQRYDFVIRDKEGRVHYRWSEGKFFATQTGEEEIRGERTFTWQSELPTLPDGSYQVEAWLTTSEGHQFSTSAGVEIRTVSPAVAMVPTAIQKMSAEALPMGI